MQQLTIQTEQPDTNHEEQARIAQIEDIDMETLKANFKQIMGEIVTAYGDEGDVSHV